MLFGCFAVQLLLMLVVLEALESLGWFVIRLYKTGLASKWYIYICTPFVVLSVSVELSCTPCSRWLIGICWVETAVWSQEQQEQRGACELRPNAMNFQRQSFELLWNWRLVLLINHTNEQSIYVLGCLLILVIVHLIDSVAWLCRLVRLAVLLPVCLSN